MPYSVVMQGEAEATGAEPGSHDNRGVTCSVCDTYATKYFSLCSSFYGSWRVNICENCFKIAADLLVHHLRWEHIRSMEQPNAS